MLLKHLVVDNFKVFRGSQAFDLYPNPSRPIILINGHNGAGKTTLMEAIKLGLHGRLALGPKTAQREYQEYLKDAIHSGMDGYNADHASIRLTVELVRDTERYEYEIVRGWDGSSDADCLCINENGQPLTGVPEADWEYFLREMVPPGVVDVMCFDGERFSDFGFASGDKRFFQTLDALFSLDLVTRLDTDLSTLSRRWEGDVQHTDEAVLLDLDDEIAALESSLRENQAEREQQENELGSTEHEIQETEQQLAEAGHGFFQRRSSLQEQQALLKGEIEAHEAQIRLLCSGPIPFALAPNITATLLQNLEQQEELAKWQAAKQAFSEIAVSLDEDYPRELWSTVEGYIEQNLGRFNHDGEQFLDISPPRKRYLHEILNTRLKEEVESLKDLVRHLDHLYSKLQEVEEQLALVPNEDTIGPLVQRLTQLHHHRAVLITKLQQLDEIRHELVERRERLGENRRKAVERIARGTAVEERKRLVAKVKLILDTYEGRVRAHAYDLLGDVIAQWFNRLSRKDGLIAHVRVDPNERSIRLMRRDGRIIDKSELSAGERHVYAFSLLAALRDVSKRSIPLIIDTPLGRLDSVHRDKLFGHFFPRVSHQVILSVTDTEITVDDMSAIEESVARSWELNHDTTAGYTEAEPAQREMVPQYAS